MPVETAPEPLFGPIKQQMNKMMEQMQKGFFSFCPSETWTPNVNLYETEQSYLVCVDLAGVVKEAIDVQVVDHHLTLRGTRAVPVKPPADEPAHDPPGNESPAKDPPAAQPQSDSDPAPPTAPPPRGRRAAAQSARAVPPAPAPSAESGQPRYRVHLMEIDHGPFCREVELPEDVRHDRISATYRNGMLWIELPKK